MQARKLKDFRIDSWIARSIARQRGEVNTTYKTNRIWAYYFSCSGHWGFIIDWNALNDSDNQLIEKLDIKHEMLRIVIASDKMTGEDYVIHIEYPNGKQKREIYFSSQFENARYIEYKYYVWEEDCDWSLYSYFLDIQYYYQSVKDWWEQTTSEQSEPTVRNRFWEEREKYNWIELKEWESPAKDGCLYNLKHKWKYIVNSALAGGTRDKSRRWHIKVNEDEVFCSANTHEITDKWYIGKRIWEEKYFLIPRDIYNTRWDRGYVIWSNPSQEKEIF